jgi:hypothetical protein
MRLLSFFSARVGVINLGESLGEPKKIDTYVRAWVSVNDQITRFCGISNYLLMIQVFMHGSYIFVGLTKFDLSIWYCRER